jgi:hypothetical protein
MSFLPALCRSAVALLLAAVLFPAAPASGWDWDGAAWADYRPFLGPIDAAMKAHLQTIAADGGSAGRVLGRMGQIGDSITESSAYFRNAILNGETSNETGHDYGPIRSWLAYSGTQPADANSFYRDHGKGEDYGNRGGWEVAECVAAGHPAQGVLIGDGVTPGQYSWAIVMFGTNDIDAGGWSATVWKEAMRAFVQGYLDLEVIPVLSTIPPEVAHLGDGRVEAANAAILELADELLVPWIDYHGVILAHQPAGWHGTLIGPDGTHPTAGTNGRGFSQTAQTTTDGYALRTKLAFDAAEKLKAIVFDDGAPDPPVSTPFVSSGRLLRASPNPFRHSVMLRVDGSAQALRIIDLSGRVLRTLPAGSEIRWDGRDESSRPVSTGVYFAVIDDGDGRSGLKIVRIR